MTETAERILAAAGVAVFAGPDTAVRALRALATIPRVPTIPPAQTEARVPAAMPVPWQVDAPTEHDARRYAASWGIPFPTELLAGDAEEAMALAGRLGWPIVAKARPLPDRRRASRRADRHAPDRPRPVRVYRGPAYDVAALAELVARASEMFAASPWMAAFEVHRRRRAASAGPGTELEIKSSRERDSHRRAWGCVGDRARDGAVWQGPKRT